MKNVLALVSLLAFANITSAQEVGTTEKDVTQSNPESILLLVNESQPNQVIVYDIKGE